jgi:hypothetical protein
VPRRRGSAEGRFTISGPGLEERAAPSLGAAISGAQTFAMRHVYDEGEITFYVRDLLGSTRARVTKPDGRRVVETHLIKENTA